MALDGAVSTKTRRRSLGFVCWGRRVQLGILLTLHCGQFESNV
ncbi:hypothetical protein F441_09128 [Phytophthora nicotianae CJ01A1]|uniref:Uncharacterized protein n=6 Tax=Phytophthora nicotianae TaxID=4792 RepID=W2Q6R0_PHYN3|nr:hypothetical protein PPTG_22992 [Phytophthora nicotianae INRA-310]ETI46456.1 hypothetical protein F443_09153 [Phytophthora nicotianae P1569]ETK86383.1 hypothetical protein L915_08977 [Phytophthora nicotianae]ETO75136.1 hypothetical protein F444_09229 [Phytophthora nicotianae P1976]ETP16239.1 hypothetical protein F441_09128 [Phytophthora nicotianae CJ01A1]ETP44315.1 hypothetical protein F442_09091 [Phytophthora nicotianae P10297]